MVEVRLLDSGRESDDREADIQQGFRDVSSEATVGSGYECDLSSHKLLLPTLCCRGFIGTRGPFPLLTETSAPPQRRWPSTLCSLHARPYMRSKYPRATERSRPPIG